MNNIAPECKALIQHLHRIQGQLNALENLILDHASCTDVSRLGRAAASSFDSFRAKLIAAQLAEHFIVSDLDEAQSQELETLLRLAR